MKFNAVYHIFVIVTTFRTCCCKNYTNYALYDLIPAERYQLEFLQHLEEIKYINVIFWTRPYKLYNNIQVLVSPNDLQMFKERLDHYNLTGTILTGNVQKLFDHQTVSSYTKTKTDTFSWKSYHSLEDVYQWMTDLANQYKDKLNLTAVGVSAEGREILAIEFSNPKAKASVIVEGTMHGHEWITTEFVTYLIYHIANAGKTKNARLKKAANKFRWIMIPVANPDGYVYSMKVDRLWRKNRRIVVKGAVGVDLNKNFDYNFCKHDGSTDPNQEYYCGPHPFSETETRSISNYVKQNKDHLNYYISFHAYGQKIIIPYSDRIKHLENFGETENYGKQAILKMYQLHGVKYGIGSIYDTYGYRSAGDSASWVKKAYKVKYALSFFLRDNGTFGHALPPEMILPTCKETLVGLIEFMTARHRQVSRELFSSAVSLSKSTCMCLLFIIFILN